VSATLAVILGALSVLALPGAIGAAQLTTKVTLLESIVIGVPAAIGLALLAFVAARVARRAGRRTLRPERIEKRARLGRRLAALGLYLGFTGGLALAFYLALKSAE
jgi:MFS-type transporter involved in bile tolerance (Atg22 family)